jgi:predicted MFS family arabinose efflux permease
VVLCVTQLAGGIAGPAIGGVLADRFGLQAPLMLAVVLAIAAVALSTGLREPQRRTAACVRPQKA